MEQFITGAITELLKFGLPGIIIIALILDRRTLQGQVNELHEEVRKQYEKRIGEAVKTVSTLGTTSVASGTMAEAIKALAQEVEDLKDRVPERPERRR
jgi:hypothetical protein